MTTQEKMNVMQGYEDGKEIQVSNKTNGIWYFLKGEPVWNWEINDYRIKPEPKYRPYKDTAEMIEDYKQRFNVELKDYEMPLIWLKQKILDSNVYVINFFSKNDVGIRSALLTMSDLLKYYAYLDGSSIGKLEG